MAAQNMVRCRFFQRAFGWCVPIGAVGGLVGLGGGELRLPVLMYAIGFDAKSAIPLNLMVSFVTLTLSMMVRSRAVSMTALVPYGPEIVGLALGGVVSAFYGAPLVRSLTSERLVQIIGVLLAGVGCLMLLEVAHPFGYAAIVPDSQLTHLATGAAIGLGIGLVSSMLGVAGGELLIPTLMFMFGADIKTAGSASILISLGVVLSGLWRYWRIGGLPGGRGVVRITGAMSAGSVVGAVLGGLAVAFAPVAFLKVLLGCVLLAAAVKTIASHR
jgi:uncharacterized membrane protein YfcA